MSGADYMLCDGCGRKAFYDVGVEYGDAAVWVLCGDCAEKYKFVLEMQEGEE